MHVTPNIDRDRGKANLRCSLGQPAMLGSYCLLGCPPGDQGAGKDTQRGGTVPCWEEKHPLHRPLRLRASPQTARWRGRKQGRRRQDNVAFFLALGIFPALFPVQLWEVVAPAKKTGAA